jgi:chromosome segregation ATPase
VQLLITRSKLFDSDNEDTPHSTAAPVKKEGKRKKKQKANGNASQIDILEANISATEQKISATEQEIADLKAERDALARSDENKEMRRDLLAAITACKNEITEIRKTLNHLLVQQSEQSMILCL